MAVPHQVVETPPGRQWVIPDMHGCNATFQKLLAQLQLTLEDQLFLLGDYINRGPDNAGVLQTIFGLQSRGLAIFPLRGNHEQMALDAHERRKQEPLATDELPFRRKKPKGLVDDEGLLLPKYFDFFASLPYYYELEQCWLVHAGFDIEATDPFSQTWPMLWAHETTWNAAIFKGKTIVRGHVTHSLTDTQEALASQANVISLDNGCYKRTTPGMGSLVCLNITERQLIVQKNVE
ncbi:MAG TPA: hypothetical protein DCE41_25430 [Cytophagales bacterium]|nr:hypothetical protein [Cytophagales bacterium]HAA17797.1 hypothetical protein [Cytophagales bacterium]HAP59984.1 hypothetical protein [Cytophagales bacterium]